MKEWMRVRHVQLCTAVAAGISAVTFQAGGEAFAALIMGIWALQLAADVDEMRDASGERT